ncbi:MAG: tryptophan synthase subunit alpha [Oscillospiraceae bacterium]|jgi:tryptophan synthase alpha chain|nr:tryptophan synthase subunit alpha [Oscillospiraceae bacterium]
MSRIPNAFKNKKAFIGFVTGGDPSLEKSEEIILEMERAGADIIEIGVPFSDPVAEGEVIQAANIRALKNAVNARDIFSLARSVRKKSEIPLVLLTYANPVYHFGYDEFFTECENSGTDGIIIPDMPFEESGETGKIAEKHGVDLISLVAPTSNERVRMIARNAKGFLYVVSSMGVTGVRDEIETDIKAIADAARSVCAVPLAVGFGISTPRQAVRLAKHADGLIVGSAIVRIIEKHGANAGKYVYEYVKKMKEAANTAV